MKKLAALLVVTVFLLPAACAGPEKKAARAQTKIHNERLKFVEQYKKCIKKAGDDKDEVEKCDTYLKAAESLK